MYEPGTKVVAEDEKTREIEGVAVTETIIRWNETDAISVDYRVGEGEHEVSLWEDDATCTAFDEPLSDAELRERLVQQGFLTAVLAEELALERRYHVPRSQVWEGSRGRQRGGVHLHVSRDVEMKQREGSRKLSRSAGAALCGKRGWYERPAEDGDTLECARCADLNRRYALA